MRSIIWLIFSAILFILLLPLVILLWIIQLFLPKYSKPLLGTRFAAEVVVPLMTKLGGCDYEIIGKENLPDESKAPYVFAGNHQGNFDTLLIQFAMGPHKITMTKWEAIYIPFANMWFHVLHCVFVKRKNIRHSIAAMNKTIDYLEHGRSVLYFPEGTRSQGPDMGQFKMGAFTVASKTGSDIVPFVIDGTYKVYEEQRKLVRSKVYFSILPPIAVNKGDDPKELCERTKTAIQTELNRLRAL